MIVAAIETNWNGNFQLLDRMVMDCSIMGIDYVKFQCLSKWKIERHPELDWYREASVTRSNIDKIDRICHNKHIEWFATPYYPEAVEMLEPYVDMYKIRYDDRLNHEIIQKCFGTGKKTIISTDKPNIVPNEGKLIHEIYCIPKYPTDYGELNFDMVRTMKGYSNHCLDPLAVLKAYRLGAEYIEFHVTSDSSKFTIDNKVSFNMGQVEEIMEWIK